MLRSSLSTPYLKPGDHVAGRYRIVQILGSGGYATVYKAEQLNLGDRPVALKVLDLPDDSPEAGVAAERFLREAEAAARINHPNVVTIFDVGRLEDDRPFMALEYCQGQPLSDALDLHGPIAPRRLQPLLIGALDGLARAHDLGIVHRDLKPDNLILTEPGTRAEALRVIDFGIARTRSADRHLTQAHHRVGTLRYLSPEYVARGLVSPALDVYQMGLVMIEALSGAFAVGGRDTPHSLDLIERGALRIPQALLEGPFGAVIARATALDVRDRFPDAAAMRDALEAIPPEDVLDLQPHAPANPTPLTSHPPTARLDTGDLYALHEPMPPTASFLTRHPPTITATAPPRRLPPLTWIAAALALCALAHPTIAALALGLSTPTIVTHDLNPTTHAEDADKATLRADNAAPAAITNPPTAKTPPDLAHPAITDPSTAPDGLDRLPLDAALAEIAAPPEATADKLAPDAPPDGAETNNNSNGDVPAEIQIVVEPDTATIREGLMVLGQGRATIRFDQDRPMRALRVTAPGHQPMDIVVAPGDEPLQSVRLERLARRPPTATPPTDDAEKAAPTTADKKRSFGIID